MSIEVEAVYESGMLKFDQPLPLKEHQRVKVVVDDSSGPASRSANQAGWWQAIQEILTEQRERRFVGMATGVDRDDQIYEQRLQELLSHTAHGSTGG